MEVKDRIHEIIIDVTNLKANDVRDDADLREDLGLDSLDIIEVVMAIEKEFGVVITDNVYDNVKTVSDVVKLIEDRQ